MQPLSEERRKSAQGSLGVISATVDLEKKAATITGSASRDALVKAVEEAGYTVG